MRGAWPAPLQAEGIVRRMLCMSFSVLAMASAAKAQKPPLLPEKDVAALAQELSGETAKRNLEGIARFHRQRGSQGFHSAAELVAERARAYGLSDVAILQFPADGKIFYGTQRSRPAWDAQSGELWEMKEGGAMVQMASYEAEPVALAEDSEFGGCRRGDERERLRREGSEGEDRIGERAARCGTGFGGGEIRRGGHRELRAESEDGVVG
jgi:hypothetical protein